VRVESYIDCNELNKLERTVKTKHDWPRCRWVCLSYINMASSTCQQTLNCSVIIEPSTSTGPRGVVLYGCGNWNQARSQCRCITWRVSILIFRVNLCIQFTKDTTRESREFSPPDVATVQLRCSLRCLGYISCNNQDSYWSHHWVTGLNACLHYPYIFIFISYRQHTNLTKRKSTCKHGSACISIYYLHR